MNNKIEINTDTMNDVLSNYIDNCTDKEWDKLLNDFDIDDSSDDYMGEARENVEEAVISMFEDSSDKDKLKMINKYSKYEGMKYCFECGKIKEEFEAIYCDNCFEK